VVIAIRIFIMAHFPKYFNVIPYFTVISEAKS